MQTPTTSDPGKPQYVRSVRFTEPQWAAVTAKASSLDLNVGTFIRNAALAAAGSETDALEMRKMADALESLTPARTPAPKPKAAPAKKAAPKKNGKR